MSNRSSTFAKRQREQDLKDRAKAKEERRLARSSTVRSNKGPEIAWDEVFVPPEDAGPTQTATQPPPDSATPQTNDDSDT